MPKVGLIPNMEKDKDFAVTKRLVAYLKERGCQAFITQKVGEVCGESALILDEENLYRESDFIISLGGDGTLLGVGRKAAQFGKPILGINLGTLGFLTAEEKNKAEYAIDKVLAGEYKVENRLMLQTNIQAKNHREAGVLALNDVCITRGLLYKILEFNIFVNDEYVDTFRADGVIICTPTGSTAYNLSAGGPVLKADAQIIAITPIAAHTLHSRSIVVSAEDRIKVCVNPREDSMFTVSADGQNSHSLQGQNAVEIYKANVSVKVIKTNSQSFYEVLRHKLSR